MLDLNKKIMFLESLIILMLTAIFLIAVTDFMLIIEGILSLIFLFIVFSLKKETGKEFKLYALFFLVLFLAIFAAIYTIAFVQDIQLKLNYSLYILGFLLAFTIAFKLLFGKNYCIARVLVSDNEIAAIQKDFDLLSFSNKGQFVVATDKMYKKNEKVKVAFAYFGFKRKPAKIIGLAD